MTNLHIVTLSNCLLSPLGTNKELAGHMVLIYQSASQTDPPGKQLASLFFSTRICSLPAVGCFCRKTGFGPDQQEREGKGLGI